MFRDMKTLSGLVVLPAELVIVGMSLGRAISSWLSAINSMSSSAALMLALVKRCPFRSSSHMGWCLLKSPSSSIRQHYETRQRLHIPEHQSMDSEMRHI